MKWNDKQYNENRKRQISEFICVIENELSVQWNYQAALKAISLLLTIVNQCFGWRIHSLKSVKEKHAMKNSSNLFRYKKFSIRLERVLFLFCDKKKILPTK